MMDFEQGSTPITEEKDEHGCVILSEAAEHMGKYRLKCFMCEQRFCTQCNI